MMQGLPSWLSRQVGAILAGGPPALTARMHALLGQPQDRTAGARYGQAPTNPQGEWGSLARMLGMAPQTPAPVGAMPQSPPRRSGCRAWCRPMGPAALRPDPGGGHGRGRHGRAAPDRARRRADAAGPGWAAGVRPDRRPAVERELRPASRAPAAAAGRRGRRPDAGHDLAGRGRDAARWRARGAAGPRDAAARAEPRRRGPARHGPGRGAGAGRPSAASRPCRCRGRPRATGPPRTQQPRRGLVAAGRADGRLHAPDPAAPRAAARPGSAPGLPPPPDGGRPAPAPDAGKSAAAEPTGWDKFKGFWTTPMGGDPTNGALAAMGLAPQAPNRLQALGSALAWASAATC
jgi:hypothetical protein